LKELENYYNTTNLIGKNYNKYNSYESFIDCTVFYGNFKAWWSFFLGEGNGLPAIFVLYFYKIVILPTM